MQSRYRIGFVVAGVFVLTASGATAQRAERLSDKEVKEIIDAVDTGRDKFEGNLDGGFKGSTLRGPNGETKVSAALQDYQDSTKKLQGRFTADYSASAEAATVLKQSMQINAFMSSPQAPTKSRNEWDRQTANLNRLAEAYGTTFPLPDGATVRRMNDKESAAAAAAVASQAEHVKHAVEEDKTLAKPQRQALKTEVEAVIKQAKTLESRLKDGKPATADARTLKEKVAALTASGRQLPPTVLSAIGGMRAALMTLDQAFGITGAPSQVRGMTSTVFETIVPGGRSVEIGRQQVVDHPAPEGVWRIAHRFDDLPGTPLLVAEPERRGEPAGGDAPRRELIRAFERRNASAIADAIWNN